MFYSVLAVIYAALVSPTLSFQSTRANSRTYVTGPSMVATAAAPIVQLESPDFYWQFRLDRLTSKKNGDLTYSANNYPDSAGARAQYDAYYLDLTLQGKMENFDWEGEKEISDSEWLSVYKNICSWTQKTAKSTKMDTNSLPANDFDFLKQFYPSVDMRGLEQSFSTDEVGASFPYKNMKELLGAASKGGLNIPGFQGTTSLESKEARSQLAALKEKTMKSIEVIYADSMAFAKNSLPDETAKKHYAELRTQLATFPQSAGDWASFRANFEKEVDEMARLAGKKEEEHHGHHEGEEDNHISPAKEFEMKYGRNLDEMQERFNKYKANPEAFLEASIMEKFGAAGLSLWKKSQEFSAKMGTMSDAEKSNTEKAFADFLKKA